MTLTVKNWRVFQHYKDRSPPWIKLQKTLLDDFVFQRLPLASKALAPMLWLLASESDDGSLPSSVEEIAFRLRWPEKDIFAGLKPLIEKGFLIDASNPLADCKQSATSETEGETEKEAETEGEPPRVEKVTKKPTGLPEDFALDEDLTKFATDRLPRVDTAEMLIRFKAYHESKGTLSKDWRASWRTYVGNGSKWGYPMLIAAPVIPANVVRYDARGRVIQ
jgi:hypothetical protein